MTPDPIVVDATPVIVANGTTASPPEAPPEVPTLRVVGGQKGPRKTVRAELTGEFEGLYLNVWTNFKRGLLREFESQDSKRTDAAIATMVLSHNLTDEDGAAYPSPLTLGALDDMPIDLYKMVVDGVGMAIKAGNDLPKA